MKGSKTRLNKLFGSKECIKSKVSLAKGLASLVKVISLLLFLWLCLYPLFAHFFFPGLSSNIYLYVCQSSCVKANTDHVLKGFNTEQRPCLKGCFCP